MLSQSTIPHNIFSFDAEFWFEGGNNTFQQQSLIFNVEQEQKKKPLSKKVNAIQSNAVGYRIRLKLQLEGLFGA